MNTQTGNDQSVEPIMEPTEIEEISPLDVIASLERDLGIVQSALRKIIRINPAFYQGGPSNQYFGRKHEKAFEHCREIAFNTLQRMDNHINDTDSEPAT